tara:strand:+ start:108 stop:1163 length:1056 start_codon:yes stop_codon:yes gene_type:complete
MLKLKKQSGYWHVVGTYLGERVRRSTGLRAVNTMKAMAEAVRHKVEKEIVDGQFGPKVTHETFRDAVLRYKEWQVLQNKRNPKQERLLEGFCEDWGDVPLRDITTDAIMVWSTTKWPSHKPGTIKRYLNDFSAVLNHASDRIDNWTAPKVKKPTVRDERDVHFEEDEANAFLCWVKDERPHYYPHFLTLVDTGVRLNELLGLRRMNFGRGNDGVLKVRRRLARSGKTKTRDVPLTQPMRELADTFANKSSADALYVASGGKPWSSAGSASAALNLTLGDGCQAIGLPFDGEDAMRVHDLRHTFAYLVAKGGADLGDLQYLMGHEDISQTMRYRGFIQSRARTYVRHLRDVS